MKGLVPALSIDPAAAAALLDGHDDYRVQRRIPRLERRLRGAAPPGCAVGIAVGVRTTGLDSRRHDLIQLAIRRFRLDPSGRIVETGSPRIWLEQPERPISAETARVTGLTDGDVAGRAIPDGEASGMILDADFVVAWNAGFGRPFVERRLPMIAGRPWSCLLADVDWRRLKIEKRVLADIARDLGWFYDVRCASAELDALLHLLEHRLPDGQRTGSMMMEASRSSN